MRNRGAYRLYLFYSGATAFIFALIFTTMAVYRVRVVGLDPLQLVLVGTALEVTYFLCNVPTGVVADTYSRRLSVILGVFLFAGGFLLEGLLPLFGAVLLAQGIEGLAYTFVEGALEAWLADEIGEERLGAAFLRGSQVGGVTGFAGIWAGVTLASYRLALPALAGGALFLALGAYLVVSMREPGFIRPPREDRAGVRARVRGSLGDMGRTVSQGAGVVRHRPLALTILLVAAIFGGYSEGWDRLAEAHLLTSIGLPAVSAPALGAFDEVIWFGVFATGASLLHVSGAEVLRRRLDLETGSTAIRALFGLAAALMVSVILFAQAGGFPLALGAYWVASTARGLVGPLYGAWLNQDVDSRVRATVVSMSGQADALGQFTVGPALGTLGSAYGLRVALSAAGLVLAPAVFLFGRALRSAGRRTLPSS